MLGQAYLAFVIGGVAYAAYLDLRTGEVPDWVSLLVAGAGLLFHTYLSVTLGSPAPLVNAVVVGTVLFLTGWIIYLMGVWGGADAFVLGAVGYAVPALPPGITPLYTAPWPFPFSLVLTVLLVGALYSIGYAVYKGATSTVVWDRFHAEVYEQRVWFGFLLAAYILVSAAAGFLLAQKYSTSMGRVLLQTAPFFLLLVILLALSRFLNAVEQEVMHRTIPVDELEPGAVLAEDIDLEAPGHLDHDPAEHITHKVAESLRRTLPLPAPELSNRMGTRVIGITDEQLDEIQEKYDTVDVKTGVRFIISFPVALLVLATVGDPLLYLIAALP